MEERKLGYLPPSTQATTSITINSVTGNQVGISYNGLINNNPGANKNFIAIYQSPTPDFPFGATTPVVASANVNGNSSGSLIIPAQILVNTSYVVGYGVGAVATAPAQTYANICATAFIPTAGSGYTNASPSLILNDVESNYISIDYNVPNGLTPGNNGAWAGLWVGNNPSYSLAPTAYSQITSNTAVGGPLLFNNIQIQRGTLYSVALFMTGWVKGGIGSLQTAMACTLQFTS
ncbi:hypothetical protein FLA_1479 [Filimonas lacunae]|nr:hypothetical protein FLA_1479 [Filimonas lacunae]